MALARRLTPPGRGGVALVALEGPGAAALLAAGLTRPLPAVGGVVVGRLLDLAGAPVDEVLVARGGDEAFEVGCHGGPAVVEEVLDALRARGARDGAPPDEERLAAEARALLPRATTALGAKVVLNGALGRAVRALLEVPDTTLQARAAGLERLLATAPLGRALLDPPRVAVVGPPNAGKSSLVNALVGRERAIVDAAAGTTRDALEVPVDLDGVPVLLVDTAGDREAVDPVERAGVARAREVGAAAALRLVVVDGLTGVLLPAAEPALVVRTKRDLTGEGVSSTTGEGLDALRAELRRALAGPAPGEGDDVTDLAVLLTPRQVGLVEGALRALGAKRSDKATTCLRALLG